MGQGPDNLRRRYYGREKGPEEGWDRGGQVEDPHRIRSPGDGKESGRTSYDGARADNFRRGDMTNGYENIV